MDLMIKNYIKVKYDNLMTAEYETEAKEFFITRLNYISEQFEEIEEYISMLDRKNTKYISTAQSRLNFLLNEETNVEGRIIECLKKIGNVDDDFFSESYFDLFIGSNIDENSLYKPVSRKAKVRIEQIIDEYEDDPLIIQQLKESLFKDNEYSVYKINEFVLLQLGNYNQIHAKEIKLKEFSDLLKIFLIKLYSANSSVDYQIVYLDDAYKSLGYKINDFIIKRKD